MKRNLAVPLTGGQVFGASDSRAFQPRFRFRPLPAVRATSCGTDAFVCQLVFSLQAGLIISVRINLGALVPCLMASTPNANWWPQQRRVPTRSIGSHPCR